MTRHELRDRIFLMTFRLEFHEKEELSSQLEMFLQAEEVGASEEEEKYISAKFADITEHLTEIDKILNDNMEGWDTTRIGKVELAVLRLAAYEICFDADIPDAVAINEAVELAKTYGQENSGSFVNAILTKVMKNRSEE